MRGSDKETGSLISYVYLEARIPVRYSLGKFWAVINDSLCSQGGESDWLYAGGAQPLHGA